MATLRADGAPRISGTEVEFEDGQVFLGSGDDARKTLDLLRDPRVAIHSPTRDPESESSWAGEAKLNGVAVQVAALSTIRRAPSGFASTSPARSTPV